MRLPTEVSGLVVHGDKIGRTIGYPTANIGVSDGLSCICFGIYGGIAEVVDGEFRGLRRLAAISYGTRPTVSGSETRFEAHLLDFSGDLYGAILKVSILKHVRPEMKFPSMAELVLAIAEDVRHIRSLVDLPMSD